jgi:hypothetical protein
VGVGHTTNGRQILAEGVTTMTDIYKSNGDATSILFLVSGTLEIIIHSDHRIGVLMKVGSWCWRSRTAARLLEQ